MVVEKPTEGKQEEAPSGSQNVAAATREPQNVKILVVVCVLS